MPVLDTCKSYEDPFNNINECAGLKTRLSHYKSMRICFGAQGCVTPK